jgi:hypothetical protein
MDKLTQELDIGEIHFRDRWQFELKSDFVPAPDVSKNIYQQEFYLFIPNSLQINNNSYSKNNFYQDQTKFIRFKTPEYDLLQLNDSNNERSPLTRLIDLQNKSLNPQEIEKIEYELKLFGNIFRTSLRNKVGRFIALLNEHLKDVHSLNQAFLSFCKEVSDVRATFNKIESKYAGKQREIKLHKTFYYVDEFLNNCVNYYLTALLEKIRERKTEFPELNDTAVADLLVSETKYAREHFSQPSFSDNVFENEYIVYRRGLLNKFILDALQLNSSISSVDQRFRNLIAATAAGVAMLLYMLLLVWNWESFAFNSVPFILFTVILYILKDRVKEGLKTVSLSRMFKWFPDFTTKIRSLDSKQEFGKLQESFTFLDEKEVPKDISIMRNREFHEVLEEIKRPEQVIYYRKAIQFRAPQTQQDPRLSGYNIILRFNIERFLYKASDPYHTYLTFDSASRSLVDVRLPKVYHLNIIMKNTFYDGKGKLMIELKKFRLIIDKNGIKHIQHLRRDVPDEE